MNKSKKDEMILEIPLHVREALYLSSKESNKGSICCARDYQL